MRGFDGPPPAGQAAPAKQGRWCVRLGGLQCLLKAVQMAGVTELGLSALHETGPTVWWR